MVFHSRRARDLSPSTVFSILRSTLLQPVRRQFEDALVNL